MSIFISYSQKDIEFANQLARDIEAEGLDVFISQKELGIGESIVQKVNEALKACNYFIVILSPYSVKSDWVRREIDVALMRQLSEKNMIILPVLYKKCDVPPLLKPILNANILKDTYEKTLDKLLIVLRQGTSIAPLPREIKPLQTLSSKSKKILHAEDKLESGQIESKQLEKPQVEIIQAMVDAIEKNRLTEEQMKLILVSLQNTLNEIQSRNLEIPDLKLKAKSDHVTKILSTPSLNVKQKLKVTLPLIPFILSYSGEVELSSESDLKAIWQNIIEVVNKEPQNKYNKFIRGALLIFIISGISFVSYHFVFRNPDNHNGFLSKEILEKLDEAEQYLKAGNTTGRYEALIIYREVINQLSPAVRRQLNQKLLQEAREDDSKGYYDNAILKYQALFKEYLEKSTYPPTP